MNLDNFVSASMQTLYIYLSEQPFTPRHEFIFNFFFYELKNIRHVVLKKNELPLNEKNIVINYSGEHIPNALTIIPFGLLEESDIHDIFPQAEDHPEFIKIFFQTKERGNIPFDIFSAAFWLLSRYEEFTEKPPSVSGDFTHRSSLSWQNDFLDFPIVDHWKKILLTKLGISQPSAPKYSIHFPVDIEISSDRLHSKYHEEWSAFLKLFHLNNLLSLFSGKKNEQKRNEEIPEFDFFHQIIRSHPDNQFIFFWNTANEKDNPLSLLSRFPSLHIVAKRLNDYAQTGLLLRGKTDTQAAEPEVSKFILRLKNIIHSDIVNVRINKGLFLSDQINKKLQLNGLKHDYSGLFYHAFGYRFSTLTPFASFDLKSNRQTDFIFHPVCTCDTFLFESDKDEQYIKKLKQHLSDFGGECNILLHQFHYTDDLEGKKKKEKLLKWIKILND
jgi:hypothetical protein